MRDTGSVGAFRFIRCDRREGIHRVTFFIHELWNRGGFAPVARNVVFTVDSYAGWHGSSSSSSDLGRILNTPEVSRLRRPSAS